MIDVSVLMGNAQVGISSTMVTFRDSKKDISVPVLKFQELLDHTYKVGDNINDKVQTRNSISIIIPTIKSLNQIRNKIDKIEKELIKIKES